MGNKRAIIIWSLIILVAVLHFIIGPHYQGPFKTFVSGYLIDIFLPMVMVLLPMKHCPKFLNTRFRKAAIVFLIGATVETLQYFGVSIFGTTFDPIDYVMYALGVSLGVSIDIFILSRLGERKNFSVSTNDTVSK